MGAKGQPHRDPITEGNTTFAFRGYTTKNVTRILSYGMAMVTEGAELEGGRLGSLGLEAI